MFKTHLLSRPTLKLVITSVLVSTFIFGGISETFAGNNAKTGNQCVTSGSCSKPQSKTMGKGKDKNKSKDKKPGNNKPGNNKPGNNKPGTNKPKPFIPTVIDDVGSFFNNVGNSIGRIFS